MSKHKYSGNPKMIMNDSLNMISKSRNKFMNNSFQQNNSGSSRKRVTVEASNYDMTMNKTEPSQMDASIKKLNATASYDIITMNDESHEFDQSYGRLAPEGF